MYMVVENAMVLHKTYVILKKILNAFHDYSHFLRLVYTVRHSLINYSVLFLRPMYANLDKWVDCLF